VSFAVAYDGEAAEGGVMDVRQLAPALLSIGKLIEDTNRVVNGDAAQVSVHIRPATREGSAIVDLLMNFGLTEQVHAMFGQRTVTDAQQMLALLGFLGPVSDGLATIKNVIAFIKALRGQRPNPNNVVELEDGDVQIAITGDNNTVEHITVNKIVFEVGSDVAVNGDFVNIFRPLRDGGITEFQVRKADGDEITERVTRQEAEYFRSSFGGTLSSVPNGGDAGEFTDWVTVRKSWQVEPQRKWQFANSTGAPFNARVTDPRFWDQLSRDQISMTPHAKFRVRVQWSQTHADATPEYEVVEVVDHIKAPPIPPQLALEGGPDE
jgi:hypothetical protein